MNYVDWIDKAKNDLLAAEAIIAYYEEPPTDTVLYHCHQVVEKCLKAFLIAKLQKLDMIHDLPKLLEDCLLIDKEFESYSYQMENLNAFFIDSKYPPDPPTLFSLDEAKEGLKQAKDLFYFVSKKLDIASK